MDGMTFRITLLGAAVLGCVGCTSTLHIPTREHHRKMTVADAQGAVVRLCKVAKGYGQYVSMTSVAKDNIHPIKSVRFFDGGIQFRLDVAEGDEDGFFFYKHFDPEITAVRLMIPGGSVIAVYPSSDKGIFFEPGPEANAEYAKELADALYILKTRPFEVIPTPVAAARAPEPVFRREVRRDPSLPVLNLAVAELTAEGVSGSDASAIANLLREALVRTGAFVVVEKKGMDKILAEQAFQSTGCTAQDCAVKLGRILNVQRMVVGSCGRLLGKYLVSIRVVSVESGAVVWADKATGGTVEALDAALIELAGRCAEQLR